MSAKLPEDYIRDADLEFFERELASFVPDRVFDAHAHIWDSEHGEQVVWSDGFPSDMSLDLYRQFVDFLHPSRSEPALEQRAPPQDE